ncbi:MAG: hypothetical protein QOK25_2332 [Thermoleophilaceae bacterium]|jgi:TusA-related sulfurtransferase|nr:hypothetical protein [Thermoleophilaceae bacterium]
MTERRIAGLPIWRRLARAATIACLLLLVGAAPAAAEQVIVDDPAIAGPTAKVTTFTGVGWDNDLLRAYAQGDGKPQVNGAKWDASVSGGTYRIDAWVPRQHAGTVLKYTIAYSGGTREVRLNQPDFKDGWVALGTFRLDGPKASVSSTDASGTAGTELAWDAIRWTKVDPPPPPDPNSARQVVDDPTILGPAGPVVTFVGIGWDGDLFSTHAQDASHSSNAADWVATLKGARYRVDAWIPREHTNSVVTYAVQHRGGPTNVPIDQRNYRDVWVTLGTYDFDGPQASVRATDASGTVGSELAWDAIRWTRIDPPPANTSPPPAPDPGTVVPPGGDQDGDSIPDALDKCPLQPAGALDSNGDGCPGPFLFVARQHRTMLAATQLLARRGGPLVAFRIEDLSIGRPKGTTVDLRCSPCLLRKGGRNHKVVKRTGSMSPHKLLKAQMRSGSIIEILVTHPTWIGRDYRFVFHGKNISRHDSCLVPPSTSPGACKAP